MDYDSIRPKVIEIQENGIKKYKIELEFVKRGRIITVKKYPNVFNSEREARIWADQVISESNFRENPR